MSKILFDRYAARDKNGEICFYDDKPIKVGDYFDTATPDIGGMYTVDDEDFRFLEEITWEMSPVKVKISIEK